MFRWFLRFAKVPIRSSASVTSWSGSDWSNAPTCRSSSTRRRQCGRAFSNPSKRSASGMCNVRQMSSRVSTPVREWPRSMFEIVSIVLSTASASRLCVSLSRKRAALILSPTCCLTSTMACSFVRADDFHHELDQLRSSGRPICAHSSGISALRRRSFVSGRAKL